MKSLIRLGAVLLGLCSAPAWATSVTLTNAAFESPGAGLISSGFDASPDIAGWKNSGTIYLNSGVQQALLPGAPGGFINASGYVAFISGGDSGTYQVTSQTMANAQTYRLVWKAASLSGLANTAGQQVTLFRTTDNGVTRTPLATSSATLDASDQVFETYALQYVSSAADAGAKIGIELSNPTGTGVVAYDDFQLDINPTGTAPATGLPVLAWDDGSTDNGTATFTASTSIDREYHFLIQAHASLSGGWRSVLRTTAGNADLYLSQGSWPNINNYNYKSDRPSGDDGFVLEPSQFSDGQTWNITVRAAAGTSFTLFSGEIYVQDLGTLGYTDSNGNGQYDIGEASSASGSGAVTVKGEGMRFFKTKVPAGTPAWSLWLSGDRRDLAVRKALVPFPDVFDRKQAGQMLVVPTYLGTGTDTYFMSVSGNPGDAITLDSRIQQVQDIAFSSTTSNVAVTAAPYRVYRVTVPINQIAWDVSTTPNSGDANVCVRRNNVPAEFDNDAFSEAPGNAIDSVTLVPDFLTNGTWFITVYGSAAYNFTLNSGNPTVTSLAFTDTKLNDQTNRAGWRFYSLSDISSQVGKLGWELNLSGQVPGTQISLRRNKVPSRWQYRTDGNAYINDTLSAYSDYSSTSGFLQRPGHQADIWYVGVFTPQVPLGGFTLKVNPIDPPALAFDNSTSTTTGQQPGKWNYVKVVVPSTTGIKGWDIRMKNATASSHLAVRRDLLPDLPYGGNNWLPSNNTTWPSGNQWDGQIDWTGRYYAAGDGNGFGINGGRIVAAMGRPLEPGTYYVGVYDDSSSDLLNYTLESRGIGTGQTIPVGSMAFSAGSTTVSNLIPREAAYFKVTVPASTPSWEFTLDPSVGEMLMALRYGAIPDFSAIPGLSTQDSSNSGVSIHKDGQDRYVMLPLSGQTAIPAGDYYFAAVSEGATPEDSSHTGSAPSSGTLRSLGPIAVTSMGTATTSGITQSVSLVSAQLKAYQFTVAAGTASLEIRLNNRVGNPIVSFNPGTAIPSPLGGNPDYGFGDGETSAGYVYNDHLITVANPPAGTYSLTVRASAASGGYPPASADLTVVANNPRPVTFDGGTSVMTSQPPGTWRYYQVTVPSTAGIKGWDVRMKNLSPGLMAHLVVRRDQLPDASAPVSWAPSSSTSWPTGYMWGDGLDWTARQYEASSISGYDSYEHRLVAAMGQPLEPGTYYVGVYNDSTDTDASYTVESRGIGTVQTIPIGTLAFSSGVSTISNLTPREAAYFKVTVPASTPSWEITLDPSVGESMMAMRLGTIPEFECSVGGSPSDGTAKEVKVQKDGTERYVLLPLSGQTTIPAGDYYIAVVSEGDTPEDYAHTGASPSSSTLRSRGPLAVTNVGTASVAGITQSVTLAGGQIKAYQFTVPSGAASLEVRLNNPTGLPFMTLLPGTGLPTPIPGSNDYGWGCGQYADGYALDSSLINLANPAPGVYSLIVRAGHDSTYPDATATLSIVAKNPVALAFDGGSSSITGHLPGTWQYFQVTVPSTAGIKGWDVGLLNTTDDSQLQMVVRRDQLPALNATTAWAPSGSTTWPTGYSWNSGSDWTGRAFNAGVTSGPGVYSHRLIAAMGQPLEPGVYYVGIYNSSTTTSFDYSIRSRGIGAGQTIPVGSLAYTAGSNVSTGPLAPREAAYYKLTVPAGAASWEFTLDPSAGEMLFAVRQGTIPDFDAPAGGSVVNNGNHEVKIQKTGPERYVMLPLDGQTSLAGGDFYIAVVSEGQDPEDSNHTGPNPSTGTLTSRGALATTSLGAASSSGITQAVTLNPGQLKSYQFTVPAGTQILEVTLNDRVGNPVMCLVQNTGIPNSSSNNNEYGSSDGQSGPNFYGNDHIVTIPNPAAGTYSLTVHAANQGGVYANASANLLVRQTTRVPLNFASALNSGGGTNTDTRQLLDGQKVFYQVAVPATVSGQPVIGWIIRDTVSQGNASIRVYKTWGDPNTGFTVSSRTAVVVPPYLTTGDTWYVEVDATGLTNYTITSEPVTLQTAAWTMPTGFNTTFGDTGAAISGDHGTDIGQDDWHFYAIDVPTGNSGLLRTELDAINGNPNLYIREDGVPTTDHASNGATGTSLISRYLTSTASEYGNWVPLDGKVETRLHPGRWYLGVKATGGTNARYRLLASTGQVTDLAIRGGSVTNQILVGRDWRYYRFTVPADAPNAWTFTFGQDIGDVVMWIRDTVPPGNAVDGLESSDGGFPNLRTWATDFKNQGPYLAGGYDAAGSYTVTTPPLRPGATYFVGFMAKIDSSFSFSSTASTGSIGAIPSVAFYGGSINTTVPANSSVLYQIPVPAEATRMKWTSTHADTVQLRLEQGTVPSLTGPQHFVSSGPNSILNQAITTQWPWVPSQTYYLRIVNTSGTAAPVTINLDGRNATTEDEDNDGLPDAWEITYFGGIGFYDGNSDPDGDGATNAAEYAAGTNPTNPNSFPSTSAYSAWAATQFNSTQLADQTISGPLADPDKDGLVNLVEFAFNLPPLIPGNPVLVTGTGTSGLPLIKTSGSGATLHWRLEYIRRKSGLTYTPEFSPDLSTSGWTTVTGTPVVTSIDATWERVVIDDTTQGAPKRFVRIRLTQP